MGEARIDILSGKKLLDGVDFPNFIRRKVERRKRYEIHATDLSRGTELGRSY